MHFWKSSVALLAGGMFAVAMPLLAQQNGAQQNGAAQSGAAQNSQAAAQPSHSASNANQHAADLLNTINQSEINAGNTMKDKTNNESVKQFANNIVDSHESMQDQLKKAASAADVSLKENEAMKKQSERMDKRLKKESKDRADLAFAHSEVRVHEHAIQQLQQLEPQVTNTRIKQVVQSSIPMMQAHLQEARKLVSELGTASGAASPASHAGQNNGTPNSQQNGQGNGGQNGGQPY